MISNDNTEKIQQLRIRGGYQQILEINEVTFGKAIIFFFPGQAEADLPIGALGARLGPRAPHL